mmetsp:Transcript_28717/g.92459  ORF Transcript_28717/g.92459 Transcript_28717/m.92459 type:complete len:230 (-) Transcript_28717:166-855(-)
MRWKEQARQSTTTDTGRSPWTAASMVVTKWRFQRAAGVPFGARAQRNATTADPSFCDFTSSRISRHSMRLLEPPPEAENFCRGRHLTVSSMASTTDRSGNFSFQSETVRYRINVLSVRGMPLRRANLAMSGLIDALSVASTSRCFAVRWRDDSVLAPEAWRRRNFTNFAVVHHRDRRSPRYFCTAKAVFWGTPTHATATRLTAPAYCVRTVQTLTNARSHRLAAFARNF